MLFGIINRIFWDEFMSQKTGYQSQIISSKISSQTTPYYSTSFDFLKPIWVKTNFFFSLSINEYWSHQWHESSLPCKLARLLAHCRKLPNDLGFSRGYLFLCLHNWLSFPRQSHIILELIPWEHFYTFIAILVVIVIDIIIKFFLLLR